MADEKDFDHESSWGGISYKGSAKALKGLLNQTLAKPIDKLIGKTNKDPLQGTLAIPIEKIFPCVNQPRQIFEPQSLEQLAKTMQEVGQAQAITVRPKDGAYEIISGERRYRAAKLAGITHLDCLIKDVENKEAVLLSLVENLQRENLLPIEEAHFLKRVVKENPNLGFERLARMLGTHKSTVSEKIQLTEVPEDMQHLLFAKGKNFTHRHWRVLSRIEDAAFLRGMILKTLEAKLSVAELERSLEAAGIQKKRRSRKAPNTLGQLSFDQLNFWEKKNNSLRIKAKRIDLEKIEDSEKKKIIEELESLIRELRSNID